MKTAKEISLFAKRVVLGMLFWHLSFGVVPAVVQAQEAMKAYVFPASLGGIQAGDDGLNQLLASKLPSDFLTDIYDASSAPLMDELYLAVSFTQAESDIINAAMPGINLTPDTYLLRFLKDQYNSIDVYSILLNNDNVFLPSLQNLILTGKNGKRLYFTGTIDDAFAGGKNDEGFIYLKGTDGDRIDIYLHDYVVNKVQDKSVEVSMNDILSGGLIGMAAPFAFGAAGNDKTTNAFTVALHTKGTNRLMGGAKTKLILKDGTGLEGMLGSMLLSLLDMSASPLAIRPVGGAEGVFGCANRAMRLHFDDKWITSAATKDYVSTNGILDLPVSEAGHEAPSINLGNAYGVCEFDGGQYVFTTALSNNMFYVSSMAICYRMISLMGMTFYGMGTSSAAPETDNTFPYNVRIKDGTFSTYSARDYIFSITDVVGHGWYKDYTDLRLPVKTIIDGGTFNNCDVYACDASAEYGSAPVNSNKQTLCRLQTAVNPADITATGTVPLTLDNTYAYYGTSSLTPVHEADGYVVYPYLPAEDCVVGSSDLVYNWISVIPLMGLKQDDINIELTMGGNAKVLKKDPFYDLPRKNSYLFYARLNDYTKQNASVSIADFPIKVELAIAMAGGYEFTEVTNTAKYTIEHGLYTMLSFNSNQWYTVCPPYDVHNIYVLETLPDDSLANNGLTPADKGTDKYLEKQGEKDGVLAQGIVTSLLPDILSGKGSGVGMNLIDICNRTLHLPPYKLTHYNPAIPGHGAADANYYLYEQIAEEDPIGDSEGGFMSPANTLEAYSEKWTPAQPVAGTTYLTQDGESFSADILMKRGQIYSLFLPAGADKYWDGKYLIFEGYGPQEMNGKDAWVDMCTPEFVDIYYETDADNVLFLQGNATFGNYVAQEQVFLPSTEGQKHDFLRQSAGTQIKPWEVYLAMSTNNTNTYASLSALSDAQAEVKFIAKEREQTDNLPSVADKSLEAYGQNGITMRAFQQQHIAVYTMSGTLLWSGTMADGDVQHLAVPAGVYLIQGERETVKIVTNGL